MSRPTARTAQLRGSAEPVVAQPRSFYLLAVLTGFAALTYQVAWQRLLALKSGAGIYSVAMIVAAFLAGLGLGSYAGGRASLRLGRRAALLGFAVVELAVAAFAAGTAPFYDELLAASFAGLYATPWRAGLAHFLTLLVPTAAMGASLPLLARAAVRDAEGASRSVAFLYAANVGGAAAGALAAPWVLLRFLGIPGAVQAAALANTLSALGAAATLRSARPARSVASSETADGASCATVAGADDGPVVPPSTPPSPSPPGTGPSGSPPGIGASGGAEGGTLALWLGLAFAAGWCAIGLEVLWFRLLDVATRSSAFTFGTLLCLYLAGLGAGAWLTALAPRGSDPLRRFLSLQCALLVCAGAAAAGLAYWPQEAPPLSGLFQLWSGGDGDLAPITAGAATLARLYLLLPALLFGLPTFLMGASFTALQRAVQRDPRLTGFRLGATQAANVAGCVAGSLSVGLVGLHLWGTAGSLRAVVASGLLFALAGGWRYGLRGQFGALVAALAALAAASPGQEALWARLNGAVAGGRLLVGEDAGGLVVLAHQGGPAWAVRLNGRVQSWLPFGGVHTLLGALPAIVHPAPRDVAVIGLGSGDTAWAAGCRPETRLIEVFEISGAQEHLLRRVGADLQAPPSLRAFLSDPRVRIATADGRHALHSGQQRYDVIEADPLHPDTTGSGNVFSVEFYRGCASRLRPGGILCGSTPTDRTAAAFDAAFPHVLTLWDGHIRLGSNEPLDLRPTEWAARAEAASVRSYLGEELARELRRNLGSLSPPSPRRGQVEMNRDLFPRDEFATPPGW